MSLAGVHANYSILTGYAAEHAVMYHLRMPSIPSCTAEVRRGDHDRFRGYGNSSAHRMCKAGAKKAQPTSTAADKACRPWQSRYWITCRSNKLECRRTTGVDVGSTLDTLLQKAWEARNVNIAGMMAASFFQAWST